MFANRDTSDTPEHFDVGEHPDTSDHLDASVHLDPDPTVTDDDLADRTDHRDTDVPPEPYPSGTQMRSLCQAVVTWSCLSFLICGIPLCISGAISEGVIGLAGVLFGLLTVIFFCLSTPAVMSLLASNRVNSKGRMKGYLSVLGLSIAIKILVFFLVWIMVIDDPSFSRHMFLITALICAIVYLIVLSAAAIRSVDGRGRHLFL